jgi:hypothetical protein
LHLLNFSSQNRSYIPKHHEISKRREICLYTSSFHTQKEEDDAYICLLTTNQIKICFGACCGGVSLLFLIRLLCLFWFDLKTRMSGLLFLCCLFGLKKFLIEMFWDFD